MRERLVKISEEISAIKTDTAPQKAEIAGDSIDDFLQSIE